MSRWISVDPFDLPNPLPVTPAVYAIYANGELVYIGETCNMRSRVHGHGFHLARYSEACRWRGQWFREITFKIRYSKRFGEEAMAERRLIRRLKPKFNRRGFKKVERVH